MIDTHVHFWNFDPVRDSWITDDMKVIRKDFSPKNLMRIYGELKISGCIAVQASQTEAENEFLLSLANHNDIIKGIVGWIDLKNPNLIERLYYWNNFKKIKGWRHVLQAESAEFILDPKFIDGIKQLKNYGYTYDLLCYHNQLESIIKMVDQIPEQPFVLDHCGKPDVKSQDLSAWAENIKILAQNPRVYCKISGLLAEADWKNWKEVEIFNCFDVIFENFGPNRVMYGSDWPVMLISRPYLDWFNLVSKYVERFTEQERKLIFNANAKAFYKV
ncbi:amidohydrolase family protein [Pedobacter endophyticus]|uniref:Amidohydrolase family protein n=1 Tax=Pedobacter endophyticus TaxID=2789740 RepID=A0A7S9L0I1_9SPHI|nr:amidohydrolase family protein [Pedobacter endophyticus]QPH40254.1 amidohydrolase family protein [Pedobacter endophyticus]